MLTHVRDVIVDIMLIKRLVFVKPIPTQIIIMMRLVSGILLIMSVVSVLKIINLMKMDIVLEMDQKIVSLGYNTMEMIFALNVKKDLLRFQDL